MHNRLIYAHLYAQMCVCGKDQNISERKKKGPTLKCHSTLCAAVLFIKNIFEVEYYVYYEFFF